MDWVNHYQLFLFDFDGILVNTEELHYLAYIKMCADRGFSLKWDQKTYMSIALYSATGIREGIYRELPELEREEPNWAVLYEEKKRAYFQLLVNRGPRLMPGVKELLEELERKKIKRCVVTHSPQEQIALIRSQNPILNTIPHWITREDYSQPKPAPESYLKAIERLKMEGDRVIGFEDSPRGLQALLGTEAEGILLSEVFDESELKEIRAKMAKPFDHYPTFVELFKKRSS